ncbi:MAG TPA: hypothetical protein DIT65_06905 [Cryomorphaceae bacterium]|nr:hypothetical protein [Cryomorphaceae bacterium]|tara:strand:- start:1611 stop:2813 length:1203 start_codon:yes stop_codon:yes gene_type:complete
MISAVKNKRKELTVSLGLVIALLMVASILMYFLEHSAQPESFPSIQSSLLWGIDKYLTSLGISSADPITPLGKILGSFIAVLGVGLFALPAGIIASGFIEEIEKDKHLKRMSIVEQKIRYAFNIEYFMPVKDVKEDLGISHLPRKWLSTNDIQFKMGISMEEVIKVCEYSNLFRLRNVKFNGEDTIGLELITLNRSYGQVINRDSDLTIMNMTAVMQPFFGHFTRCIAELTNANYISNELYSPMSFIEERSLNLKRNSFEENDKSHPSLQELIKDITEIVRPNSTCIYFVNASRNEFLMQFNNGGEKENPDFSIGKFFKKIDRLEDYSKRAGEVCKNHEMEFGIHHTVGLPPSDHITHFIHERTKSNVLLLHVNSGILKKKAIVYYKLIADFASIFNYEK